MWNSLEIAKLVVSALTPVVIVFLTLAINRRTKQAEVAEAHAAQEAENAEWANRRAVDRLLELHKDIAPLMNDLLCFFTWVGHFRDIDPPTALETKRNVDKIYFVNKHLFDQDFRDKYTAFINECFLHSQRAGENAKLRTSKKRLAWERSESRPWETTWDSYFDREPDNPEATKELQIQRYEEAMEAFAYLLGLQRNLPTSSQHVSAGAGSIG